MGAATDKVWVSALQASKIKKTTPSNGLRRTVHIDHSPGSMDSQTSFKEGEAEEKWRCINLPGQVLKKLYWSASHYFTKQSLKPKKPSSNLHGSFVNGRST